MSELEPKHEEFLTDIKRWMRRKKFIVPAEMTYHSIYSVRDQRLLADRWSMTALSIRSRADRVAIHKKQKVEFEWDAKVHKSTQWNDMTLEMMPIIFHKLRASLGVDILYAYRDLDGNEYGFWIDDMPQVREVKVPDRWSIKQRMRFRQIARQYIPTTTNSYKDSRWKNGSGDPYLIVARHEIDKMQDWRKLILDKLRESPP